MKKLGAIILTAAVAVQAAAFSAFAADDEITVHITIGAAGELAIPCEDVAVKDRDGDGVFTIDEALYAVHDLYYEGGAAAGYTSAESDWGLSIKKLWGLTNNGSFGYTVNDEFAMGLSDPVKNGDYLSAYAMKDAAGYSDAYCYFDVKAVPDAKQGDTLTLNLKKLQYVGAQIETSAVPDAVITVDGEETAFKTDANGSVQVTLDRSGDMILGIKSEQNLVPLALRVHAAPAETTATVPAATTTTAADTTVTTAATTASNTTAAATTTKAQTTASGNKDSAPKTGDTGAMPAVIIAALTACGTAFAFRRRREE